MRIGLFTDTYRPAQNGVVVVVDVTRRELEALGHEVFVFAPSANLVNKVSEVDKDDDHLIHFPAIRGAGFDEGQISVFSPHALVRKIRNLDLDVLHFFTAGQMALFCCYAAKKTGVALVGQHCTDTYEYSDSYKLLKLGYAMMAPMMARAVSLSLHDTLDFLTLQAFKRDNKTWGKRLISATLAEWYQACDATIAVSQKSADQLNQIASDHNCKFNLSVIPTGVNAPIPVSDADVDAFRNKFDIAKNDEVIIYYGRLSPEKNLAMLIPMLEHLLKYRPQARLVYAGDWEYRATLQDMAKSSPARNRITFVGRYARSELDILNKISSIYAFPSLTDTQGLVVTEAAHGGLPIVLCDPLAPACFKEGINGLTAQNDPVDFANKVNTILSNKKLYNKMSAQSKKLASSLTEAEQTRKLVDIYRAITK